MVVRFVNIGKHFIVLLLKGSNLMVCFLIEDIIDRHIPLAFGKRKCTVSRLPLKFMAQELFLIDLFAAVRF